MRLKLLRIITKIDTTIRVSKENFCLSFFVKKADLMAITKSSLPVAIFTNIQITDDVDEENYTSGALRKISVTIRLYHRLEGMQEHNKNKSIQNRYAERIRSLIEENSNYKVSGTPQWINGEVLDIDYEPSVEDDENNFMVCELSCEFMTMQTFIVEE